MSTVRIPADLNRISVAAMVDDSRISYFDVVQALSDLIATGHVDESTGSGSNLGRVLYAATAKGKANCEIMLSDLPYSLRRKVAATSRELARELEIEQLADSIRKTENREKST
jgi:hypothetical protein